MILDLHFFMIVLFQVIKSHTCRLIEVPSRKLTLPMSSFIMSRSSEQQYSPPLVILLSGATSSGKSAVAKELCKLYDAEICCADSVQIYKHLNIGSNKPSISEQSDVPHHLVDVCENTEILSSGDFVRMAVPVIEDIVKRGKVPIIVGGSTMWIQWLVHGVPDAPKATEDISLAVNSIINKFEESSDWDKCVNLMTNLDPDRIKSISRNDWYRLRRFLEISFTHMPLTDRNNFISSLKDSIPTIDSNELNLTPLENITSNQNITPLETTAQLDSKSESSTIKIPGKREFLLENFDLRCFFLSGERIPLYRTIDARCVDMIDAGLLEEVTELIINGQLGINTMGARAIGYRQTIEYLCTNWKQDEDQQQDKNNEMEFEKYLNEFATATRNYAKRQLNWHRKDNKFLWLQIDRANETPPRPTSYASPCGKIAKEIEHWCHQDARSFQETIDLQLSRTVCADNYINNKNFYKNNKMLTTDEADIIQILESVVKVKKTKKGNNNDKLQYLDSLTGASVHTSASLVSPCDVPSSKKQKQTKFSAEDLLIRSKKNADETAKLRCYVSNFDVINVNDMDRDRDRLRGMLERADRCAMTLRTQCPERVQQLSEWLRTSTSEHPSIKDI